MCQIVMIIKRKIPKNLQSAIMNQLCKYSRCDKTSGSNGKTFNKQRKQERQFVQQYLSCLRSSVIFLY